MPQVSADRGFKERKVKQNRKKQTKVGCSTEQRWLKEGVTTMCKPRVRHAHTKFMCKQGTPCAAWATQWWWNARGQLPCAPAVIVPVEKRE